MPALEDFKGLLNGFHVSIPQERSDALKLSSPCPVTRYFSRESDGIQNFIRNIDMLKLFRRQIHKLLAQRFQGRVFIFPLGSAFIIDIHRSNPLSSYSYTSLPESANLTA
jgi:hypothetical protein